MVAIPAPKGTPCTADSAFSALNPQVYTAPVLPVAPKQKAPSSVAQIAQSSRIHTLSSTLVDVL